MKLATVLLLAMCVIGAVYAEDVDVEDIADDVEAELDEEVVGAAHCILYKKISAENDRVVKDRNFTQEYTVYNVGAGPCFDVSVSESVPSAHFEIVEGAPEEFFEKIEAGEKASFNVTLMPKIEGVWTPARATLEYRDAATGEDRTSYSTTTGALQIMSEKEYIRAVATFEQEWAIFGALSLLPVAVPFLLYRSAASAAAGSKKRS